MVLKIRKNPKIYGKALKNSTMKTKNMTYQSLNKGKKTQDIQGKPFPFHGRSSNKKVFFAGFFDTIKMVCLSPKEFF